MSKVEERLKEMGLELPECPTPVASYVVATQAEDLIFVSGQTAWLDGKLMYQGKVGNEIGYEDAYESAKLCALRCISELKAVADLDKIKILKVLGFVNADPEYKDHPKIMNGASELLEKAFLENGKHARSAIGIGSLPDNASVEVELIATIIN